MCVGLLFHKRALPHARARTAGSHARAPRAPSRAPHLHDTIGGGLRAAARPARPGLQLPRGDLHARPRRPTQPPGSTQPLELPFGDGRRAHSECGARAERAGGTAVSTLHRRTPPWVAGGEPGRACFACRFLDFAHVRVWVVCEQVGAGRVGHRGGAARGGSGRRYHRERPGPVISRMRGRGAAYRAALLVAQAMFCAAEQNARAGRQLWVARGTGTAPRPVGSAGGTAVSNPSHCPGGLGGRYLLGDRFRAQRFSCCRDRSILLSRVRVYDRARGTGAAPHPAGPGGGTVVGVPGYFLCACEARGQVDVLHYRELGLAWSVWRDGTGFCCRGQGPGYTRA